MRRLLRLALLLCLAMPLEAQTDAPLVVTRPDGSSTTLTSRQLAALPRLTGTATAHATTFTYEGHDLRAVLALAGVTPVDSLGRAQLRRVILFHGADGYSALVAMTDLDSTLGARRMVLVDREDGRPLPDDRGPRRMIVEGDRRPSRWVRQVVRLEVREVPQ